MNAENLLVNDGRQWQEVHYLCAVAPDIDRAILAQALIVKAIDLRYLPRLMIASNKRNVRRVPNLESKEEKKCLDTVKATIDKIAHEEVIRARAIIANPEKLH